MPREDFIDAPSAGVVADTTAGPPAPRRPFHGGWALMVAAGLIAAVANYAVLTAEAPSAAVAVVAARVPAGTPVEALEITALEVGLDDPAVHLMPTPDEVRRMRGVVTATALEPGALLRTTDLRQRPGEGLGAMGVPVDPARAAGGLLQPGDHVDVIAGGAARDGVADDVADDVAYVVRDAEVLGVLAPGSGIGSASGSYSVTLAVDDDQALALAQALRAGDVDLVRAEGTSRAAAAGDGS